MTLPLKDLVEQCVAEGATLEPNWADKLGAVLAQKDKTAGPQKMPRHSPETRAKMAAAQRERWAEHRKKQVK